MLESPASESCFTSGTKITVPYNKYLTLDAPESAFCKIFDVFWRHNSEHKITAIPKLINRAAQLGFNIIESKAIDRRDGQVVELKTERFLDWNSSISVFFCRHQVQTRCRIWMKILHKSISDVSLQKTLIMWISVGFKKSMKEKQWSASSVNLIELPISSSNSLFIVSTGVSSFSLPPPSLFN